MRYGRGGDNCPRTVYKLPSPEHAFVRDGRIVDPDSLFAELECILESEKRQGPLDSAVLTFGAFAYETLRYTSKGLFKLLTRIYEETSITRMQLLPTSLALLYGMSRDTGLVLDLGLFSCRVTPIHESQLLPQAARSIFPEGGAAVTRRLQRALEMRGFPSTSQTYELIDLLKQKACFIAPDPHTAAKLHEMTCLFHADYRLPDGCQVQLSHERYTCPENTFFSNVDHGSIVDSLAESLQHCPMDIRRVMLENVVVGGSGSAMGGLSYRLERELTKAYATQVLRQADSSLKAKVLVPEKGHDVVIFRGASILATLDAADRKSVV